MSLFRRLERVGNSELNEIPRSDVFWDWVHSAQHIREESDP
jgi:hypothetical protein